MELDSFTQKLLERTQARRENINKKMTKSPSRRLREPLIEDNFEKLTANEESQKRKLENEEDSPSKRQSMEGPMEKENMNEPGTEEAFREAPFTFGLKGLAALKRSNQDGAPASSIYPQHAHKEAQGFIKSPSASKLSYTYQQPGNNAITDRVKMFEQQKSQSGLGPSPTKGTVHSRTVKWPPESIQEETNVEENKEFAKPVEPLKKSTSQTVIPAKEMADKLNAIITTHTQTVQAKASEADPSSYSLAARKALFESPKKDCSEVVAPELLSVAERANLFEKAMTTPPKKVAPRQDTPRQVPRPLAQSRGVTQKSDTVVNQLPMVTVTPPTPIKTPGSINPPPPPPPPMPSFEPLQAVSGILRNGSSSALNRADSAAKKTVHFLSSSNLNVEPHTKQLQQRLLEDVTKPTENHSVQRELDERRREIEALKSRNFRQPHAPIQAANESEVSETDPDLSTDGYDEQESEVDPPVGFDSISSTEDESALNISFLKPYLSQPMMNHQASFSSEAAAACKEIDSVLEEAMEGLSDSDEDNVKSAPKLYPALSEATSSAPVITSPAKPPRGLPNEATSPLMHSVSFYRRQKQLSTTPVRTVKRVEVVLSPPSPSQDGQNYQENVELKIRRFQEDLHRQDVQVKQTCQALFLCAAKPEFFGSAEHVEGERLLLIASFKRNAFRSAIEQLKTEVALGSSASRDQGTLTISEIRLPLKQEFLAAQIAGQLSDAIHYFFGLIRYREKVIATEMLSTKTGITTGTFSFSNHICLQELRSNFNISFEVYALQTSEEVLPHEKKYNIKKDSNRLKLTPKAKKYDSRAKLSPALSSPATATQERPSNFDVVGSLKLNLDNCRRRILPLEKVPLQSPLEGRVSMRIQLCTEQPVKLKSFLTMFEDVSGFGAWHRRWCVLAGNHLSYWKYPDQEKSEVPIGSIDLRQCITPEVGQVASDICARKHTFMLLCVRPQTKGDQNTLVMERHSAYTTTKNLLSADTKEERVTWCSNLNRALEIIRKWDPEALRPLQESSA